MDKKLQLLAWISLLLRLPLDVSSFLQQPASSSTSSSSSARSHAPPSRSLIFGVTTSSPTNHRTLRSKTALYAFDHRRPSDSSSGNNEEDEEGDVIDLSSQDWRAFRAHLVQSEVTHTGVLASSSRGPKEENSVEATIDEDCIPESGDCDLDGLGSVFGLKASSSSSSSSSSRNKAPSAGSVQVPPPHSSLLVPPLSQENDLTQQHWAYDSGQLIETGAVLLGGVEQEFGFGLRQQYFHKAAILVLDHCESTFTKGIILNRPTDFYIHDDLNPDCRWRVWFGGDVQGLTSDNPDYVCLHSLDDPQARHASIPVMNEIQWTTFDNAKRLVRSGVASPNDFWVFCGYAGWGAGQLVSELDRNSWYMVATDSNTVLQQLQRQSRASDPRDAGLETWSQLMDMIGRGAMANAMSDDFDDLMLKEWAHQHLLSSDGGGGAGPRYRPPEGLLAISPMSLSPYEYHMRKEPVDRVLHRAQSASRDDEIVPGSLVRASPTERSPFLLHDQELHKSIVLILSDDEQMTVGAILNRPAAKGLDIRIAHKHGAGESRKVTLPLRFGGQYSVKNGEPIVWLHCNSVLRAAKIGEPLGYRRNGIWKCTAADVTNSIGQGLATPEDFFVVTGVTVWAKEPGGGPTGDHRGMQGEIRKGTFEVIPHSKVEDVWESLAKQDVLTNGNMRRNLDYAEEAWLFGGTPYEEYTGWADDLADSMAGYKKSDTHHVFKSHVKVSELSDEALQNWVSIFLLGNSNK